MAAQWPLVHARLVALLPTLSGWPSEVYDGPPVTGDNPARYATVGYVFGEDGGGSFTTDTAGNGFQIVESGSVRGEIVATTGAADLVTVRAQAFAMADALEASIRADRTLGGVLSAQGTAVLRVDVLPTQTTQGATQRLPFTVDYTTVT